MARHAARDGRSWRMDCAIGSRRRIVIVENILRDDGSVVPMSSSMSNQSITTW